MPRPLTNKQNDILETIWAFSDKHGYPPTLQELANELELTASTIQGHVDRLIRKGALSRDGDGRRTLRIIDPNFTRKKHPGMPLCGRIQAGVPLEPIEQAELVEIKDLINPPDGCYLLQVTGESMIEAGILDGDYVVIDPKRQPRNGNIVVGVTPDGEATLKEFYREGNVIRLQPRNPLMSPIYVPSCEVRGVMVALVRAV